MFRKVLVANRGESAVRVMRTLREMGIRSVAVCSDADRGSLHATTADECVSLGEPAPAASYLNVAKLVEAARRTGAEAVHPGYGFLSENPAFARAVTEAGLVFIGPPAEVLSRLRDKTAARRQMRACGIPILPGMTASEADPERLAAIAAEIGYPVVLKPSTGGGGKGMRVVHDPTGLREALAARASEAEVADDELPFLETFLAQARHVEFQVLADGAGNGVHLFERECSIQRRHQKLVEETPSPMLDPKLRDRMGEAAVAAARSVGYVNAGTVEFLVGPDRSVFFLEFNPRLQVEHPITELVTGLDLVRLQIQIAAGELLPFRQEDLVSRGHAIECRIYAEDPARGFYPSSGRVLLARPPEGPGIRWDSGVATGSDVPVQYDSLLGKLSVHAPDRPAAIARMERALRECVILGVQTPIAFFLDLFRLDAFRNGDIHTAFLDEHLKNWRPAEGGQELTVLGFALERRATGQGEGREGAAPATEVDSPWHRLGPWDLARRRR